MNNHIRRLTPDLKPQQASPPKLIRFPSDHQSSKEHQIQPPVIKNFASQRKILFSPNKAEPNKPLGMNNLFTIQENHYTRKNHHIIVSGRNRFPPLPPRSPNQQLQVKNEGSLQRKVAFTDRLVSNNASNYSRESSNNKPIIKNLQSPTINDNQSTSSRSISVKQSVVTQFRSPLSRPRPDSNKEKYSQMMENYKKRLTSPKSLWGYRASPSNKQQCYTDVLFPPRYTSLFHLNPRCAKLGQNIQWKRLSDIFSGEATLFDKQNRSLVRVVLPKKSYSSEHVAIALNALSHSGCILQKIFQDQSFNKHGLYLMKIFQQYHWKTLILDDFLPVQAQQDKNSMPKGLNNQKSAFVQVAGPLVQVWPYLLQKAFANYYSAYQMLRYGNAVDLFNQFMGLVPENFIPKKWGQKDLSFLKTKLQQTDSVALGQINEKGSYMVIWHSNHSSLQPSSFGSSQTSSNLKSGDTMLICSFSPDFLPTPLTSGHFQRIRCFHIYSPKTYPYLSVATIGKYAPKRQNLHRAEYSLRKLKITQPGPLLMSIQQKQARFFAKTTINYKYMWIRMILVQREYDGYRWIDGVYSQNKSTVLQANLTPGEYYLLVLPQWKTSNNFQLNLLVWGNNHVQIEKANPSSCQQMIQQACMDLAQRKGKINQMGPTLCCYNYICPRTGLIIQNINNQKLKQQVQIQRNVSGIPCSVQLLPVNRQFWTEGKLKSSITVIIPKLSSYTVVLRMSGGFDKKLIKIFSFQDI